MIRIVVALSAPSYLVLDPNQIIKGYPETVAEAINAISPVSPSFLLMETGDFLLLETGDKILLE